MKLSSTKPVTSAWQAYEKCKEYNYSIDLYNTVNTNERFYRGDQWKGVEKGNLPTPVFNLFKRIIGYYSSTILQSAVRMRYSYASPIASGLPIGKDAADEAVNVLNSIAEERWEKLKMDDLLYGAITDAAITGDAVCYTYWDPSQKTGQAYKGNFVTALIDNTNVFMADPTNKNLQSQPYIIISQREYVTSLRAEAKKNGVSEEAIAKIVSDDEAYLQSGDLAKAEPSGDKCTSLILLWKDDEGVVNFRKCTRSTYITDIIKTGLTRYPVAYFNWTPVKNSWHGQAVATGLIENQIFINKSFAMVMKHLMDTAFSKVIYDANVIDDWSDRVGEAIAVNGPVDSVAKVLGTGQMQAGMLDVINMAINSTKEFLGATDTALGDVAPTNTSAILALQNASNMPLENIKRTLYSFVEDIGLIWLDFIFNYYDDRRLIKMSGGEYASFPLAKYRDALFDCRVDVGASNYWSEIASLGTLDNLLGNGQISLYQYLERLPDNLIPKKNELMEEIKANEQKLSDTDAP